MDIPVAQNAVQYLTNQQAETRENNTMSSEMRKQHKEDEAQQAIALKTTSKRSSLNKNLGSQIETEQQFSYIFQKKQPF